MFLVREANDSKEIITDVVSITFRKAQSSAGLFYDLKSCFPFNPWYKYPNTQSFSVYHVYISHHYRTRDFHAFFTYLHETHDFAASPHTHTRFVCSCVEFLNESKSGIFYVLTSIQICLFVLNGSENSCSSQTLKKTIKWHPSKSNTK